MEQKYKTANLPIHCNTVKNKIKQGNVDRTVKWGKRVVSQQL